MGINFQNVDFKYSKKASYKQLDQVSLNINEKDEFVMIVGHTGSGKSTLVQHMNGLLLATSGRVEVFNINVIRSKKIKLKPVREHVGLVFQFPEYQIFESTVLEDIMFGPKNFGKSKEEAKQLAIQAAHRIGINDEILERSPFTLSGGQMRRVAIAGAMAINPDILILDEPTVGLDPKGKDELMNLLVHMHNETHKTIIMISHDMDIVASYAKRILVMDQGKLIYDGDKEGLFADEEFLRQHNLDLPVISTIAKGLKAKGFIQYDQLPLTKDELYDIIVGGKTNE
ncbi:MAG TPA: energy-coupling factor transporter ATPase [Acholeplasmatales bacterium]|jgi:cobalt import ATP-binding protein cbiO 2|nr:energy-coupling factor transporter ATPase [Acholeplasmatales bacterium]